MRYSLRTLLIALAIAPPLLWGLFWLSQKYSGPPEDSIITEHWIEMNGRWTRIYPPEPPKPQRNE